MALRATILLLLIAVAFVAEASAGAAEAHIVLATFALARNGELEDPYVGDLVGDEEMNMESEVSRRGLYAARRRRYISYGALSRNRVPCSIRGQSYYNCRPRNRANPYRRGCSAITRCARYTH